MRLSISTEGRFLATPDGAVWTDGALNYDIWSRYLAAFDGVNVIARVAPVAVAHDKLRRVDGPGVEVSCLPTYLGPWQYLLNARAVKRAAQAALAADDAVLLNIPGNIANCVAAALAPGRPYAAHVIGDCQDTFAVGVMRHPLRPLLQWWFVRNVRRQLAAASAALYVTRRTLQARYPCRGQMAGISDVDLPNEAIVHAPRSYASRSGPLTIVNIGTMSTQFIKGLDVLIDALGQCVPQGLDLRLVLIGGGRFQGWLQERARALGLQDRVVFCGQLPAGLRIREELDRADLFVLPSRIEGLPRALVEAMARALPCISTSVGGIPELLPADELVPAGDVTALANKIAAVVTNPQAMSTMSARNLAVANSFRAEVLRPRRAEFFQLLAEQTAAWNRRHDSALPPVRHEQLGAEVVEHA